MQPIKTVFGSIAMEFEGILEERSWGNSQEL
jgi:hypothetical protein